MPTAVRLLIPLLLLLASLPALAQPAAAPWAMPILATDHVRHDESHTSVRLIAEQVAAAPGSTIRVGLLLEMDPTWHTYWINPGVAGLTTEVEWTLPGGVTAGPIDWPTPIKFGQDLGIIGYGYEGRVLLPVELQVPEGYAEATLPIRAQVDWLACADICVPGEAALTLTLPVTRGEPDADPRWAEAFDTADRAQPAPAAPGFAAASRTGDDLQLSLDLPPAEGEIEPAVTFYPDSSGQIEDRTEQPVRTSDGRTVLTLRRSDLGGDPDRLSGLVVIEADGQRRAVAIDTPVEEDVSSVDVAAEPDPTPAAGEGNTAGFGPGYALYLALVGGVILNLMPCVFPVLAIKITGFVRLAGSDRRQIARHGWVFAAGVLVSFWVLALLIIAIQASGRELGWGFQLQSPVVVGLMALLLFAVGLNLAGVFDVGIGVMNTAGRVGGRLSGASLAGTFGSGVLAVALATPCSAPFMAPAVGYALTSSPATIVLVLTALGVGVALPYLLLSLFPQWLSLLPKPGPWMETFKQLMAFPCSPW